MPPFPDPTTTEPDAQQQISQPPEPVDAGDVGTARDRTAAQSVTEPGPEDVGATPAGSRIQVRNRPNMAVVGTTIWLIAQLMFFTGLFGIYFTARAVTPGAWPPIQLDIPYVAALTAVLLASSVTCQLGAAAAANAAVPALRRWYGASMLLGVIFVVGQLNQYRMLLESGLAINASAFSGVFYLTTGFHLLTVIGGVIVLGQFVRRSTADSFTPARSVRALVVSYCWHFTVLAWIGVFVAVYLIH